MAPLSPGVDVMKSGDGQLELLIKRRRVWRVVGINFLFFPFPLKFSTLDFFFRLDFQFILETRNDCLIFAPLGHYLEIRRIWDRKLWANPHLRHPMPSSTWPTVHSCTLSPLEDGQTLDISANLMMKQLLGDWNCVDSKEASYNRLPIQQWHTDRLEALQMQQHIRTIYTNLTNCQHFLWRWISSPLVSRAMNFWKKEKTVSERWQQCNQYSQQPDQWLYNTVSSLGSHVASIAKFNQKNALLLMSRFVPKKLRS